MRTATIMSNNMSNNVLPVFDPYADTLLALGIAAAYNVQPSYHGSNYLFPAAGDAPIAFPVSAGEDDPQPPFTFHRFQHTAIRALGGRKMLETLETQWNEAAPQYAEILPLLWPGAVNYAETRFWHIKPHWTGAATFRPQGVKGSVEEPTLKEFWLLDALRAIGFLTYASPRLFPLEASTCRWLVFVPVVPNAIFRDAMMRYGDMEVGIRAQLLAHTIASELGIPRVQCVQYAELNPLARTPLKFFALEPRAMAFEALQELKRVNAQFRLLRRPEQARLAGLLVDALERQDTTALMKLTTALSPYTMRGDMQPMDTNLVSALMTSARLVESW